MDTQIGDPDYQLLLCIKSFKLYAYERSGKRTKEMLKSLNEFIKVEPKYKSISIDEDTTYFSQNFVISH